MLKNIFSVVVLIFMAFLYSCAPEGSGANTGRPKEDQVNEQAINLLAANKWCQLNATTGTAEYLWVFDKKLTVTSTHISSQQEEAFVWTINSYNILSVALTPQVAALFTKQVFYSFDVNKHKRTMYWKDSTVPEVINFIECE